MGSMVTAETVPASAAVTTVPFSAARSMPSWVRQTFKVWFLTNSPPLKGAMVLAPCTGRQKHNGAAGSDFAGGWGASAAAGCVGVGFSGAGEGEVGREGLGVLASPPVCCCRISS